RRPGVDRHEPLVDGDDGRAGPGLVELLPQQGLTVPAPGLGERPPLLVGERRPAHPAHRLGVEELLLRALLVEAEPGGERGGAGDPRGPPGVEGGQLDGGTVAHQSPSGTATVPAVPSTTTGAPSVRAVRAPAAPATAGIPSSRATMAAWLSIPPVSVTTAAA